MQGAFFEGKYLKKFFLKNSNFCFGCQVFGTFEVVMRRSTSILLGEHFENFIDEQVASGKYNSASEVVRTALRAFEREENKRKALINELEIGEKSRKIKNFDPEKNLEKLHANFPSY